MKTTTKQERNRKQRIWLKANPDKRRKYYETQYARRKDKIKAYAQKYWNENKKELSQKYKMGSAINQGIVRRAGYKYFVNNKDRVHKRNKKYRQNNMDKVLYWINARKIKKNGNLGSHTLEQWNRLLDRYEGACPRCNIEVGRHKLTRDHIIPVGQNGTDNINNIQALCKVCNSAKGTKTIKYPLPTLR